MPDSILQIELNRRDAAMLAWLAGEGMRTILGLRINEVENTEVVALAGMEEARATRNTLLQDIPEIASDMSDEALFKLIGSDYKRIIGPVTAWLDTPPEGSGTTQPHSKE